MPSDPTQLKEHNRMNKSSLNLPRFIAAASVGAVVLLAGASHSAQALSTAGDPDIGGKICLSTKSARYSYLEAKYLNWSGEKYINRGECSTDEWPGHFLDYFSPSSGYHCYDQWGRVYTHDRWYRGSSFNGSTLTCYVNGGGSWKVSTLVATGTIK